MTGSLSFAHHSPPRQSRSKNDKSRERHPSQKRQTCRQASSTPSQKTRSSICSPIC
jgi:hypothetical protein